MYMVRGTELQDFLRCRKMWSYRWIDGLQPKKQSTPLLFGTAMHKFLEFYYGPNYGWNDSQVPGKREGYEAVQEILQQTDMDEVEYQEMKMMLDHVITNYSKQYHNDFENWEVIATEFTFAIPLDDEIGYTGTIDLIVRDKSDGRIYFLDHKTTNSIEKYDKNSDMDRQISRYWWALQQLQQGNGDLLTIDRQEGHTYSSPVEETQFYKQVKDAEIGGFIYNVILKDYPVPPKVLKNGSLSRDKSQRTTADLYVQALLDQYAGPDDAIPSNVWNEILLEYHEILQHLKDSPKEFFRRIRVTRNQAEIDASIEELYATAREMEFVQRHVKRSKEMELPLRYNPVYRNITRDCPWCPFQPICQASMDGSNVEFLTETLYTVESTER